MALLFFSRDFSGRVLEVFSRIRKSFFSSLEATGPTPFRSVPWAQQQSHVQPPAGSSSISTAAVREEASAHYIRPIVPILSFIFGIGRLWHFHHNNNFTRQTYVAVNHLFGWLKPVSMDCQAHQLDYFIYPALKSKQDDCVKSCSQSFACSLIFRQATRQGSPPIAGKLALHLRPGYEKSYGKISTEALQGHFGPCWLFTSVKYAEDAGRLCNPFWKAYLAHSNSPAVCE